MIWVIGGTSDAIKIVDLLVAANKEVVVTTTTSYGADLAKRRNVFVLRKQLDEKSMNVLLKEYSINTVVDGSHPFAKEVSLKAIKACEKNKTKYIRFERKSIEFKKVHYYPNYAKLLEGVQGTHGNILLTIGSKNVGVFEKIIDRLVCRVLPVIDSIRLCENIGLKAHQILAMKGRVSKETNLALMQEYDIKHLVTKDSGDAGGLNEKVEAALQLSIEVHILQRPHLPYPIKCDNFETLLQKI